MAEHAFRRMATPQTGSPVTGIMQVVDLEAAAHAWEIAPGMVVHGHAFNGQVPGPTIEATAGDTLAVRFTNRLLEPASIQWHGLPDDPGTADRTPQSGLAPPGGIRDYQIVLSDAGTFWYQIPPTAAVGPGLHGAVLVRHAGDPARDAERLLIITAGPPGRRDARQPDNGSRPGDGEVLLVNGISQPQLVAAPGQLERLLLINLTRHELRLSLGRHRHTAVHGGDCYSGAASAHIMVAPSNRSEVVLGPFPAGETVRLQALPNGSGSGDHRPRRLATLQFTL
jgi:FtsP/CotA-like multicopper oxidase with cupredoxin domain